MHGRVARLRSCHSTHSEEVNAYPLGKSAGYPDTPLFLKLATIAGHRQLFFTVATRVARPTPCLRCRTTPLHTAAERPSSNTCRCTRQYMRPAQEKTCRTALPCWDLPEDRAQLRWDHQRSPAPRYFATPRRGGRPRRAPR